jgi:hypothetical protein
VTLVDASILRLAGASDELPAMVAQELTVTETHVTKRRATAGKGRALHAIIWSLDRLPAQAKSN